MFANRIALLGAILAAAAAGNVDPGQTKAEAVEINDVELEIVHNGSVIGTPKLMMQVGTTASVRVDRPNGYDIKLSLDYEARLTDGRKLDLVLATMKDGQSTVIATPSISLALDKPARIKIARQDGQASEIGVLVKTRSESAR